MAKKKEIEIQYFSIFARNLVVPFEQFFGPEYEDYDEFTLSLVSKKSYAKIADLIVSENNRLLNENKEIADKFMYKYLVLKKAIDGDHYNSSAVFITELVGTLLTGEIIDQVRLYVEKHYETNVDEGIDLDTHKFDKGTTFLDRHYKALYTVSCLARLIIPMCTHFVHRSGSSVSAKSFFFSVMMTLFNVVQDRSSADIYTKLHTYISRAVRKTLTVDKKMWEGIEILSVTPENVIEDALKRMVTDVIPKFVFDKNIMNLITVVIRQFIVWTIRKEHPYNIYQLVDSEGQNNDDDSVVTESDIFDSYAAKRDESILLFRKFYGDDTINKIMQRSGVIVTPDELDYYRRTIKFHDMQKFFIFQAFGRFFGGSENLSACYKENYIKLMIILVKMMYNLGITTLPQYIVGVRKSYNYRRTSKAFEASIANDPLYVTLVEDKYGAIKGVMDRKNFIRHAIVTLLNNTYTYNALGEARNGDLIEKDEEAIKSDTLKFFNMLIA
jgi:hypothetical protein